MPQVNPASRFECSRVPVRGRSAALGILWAALLMTVLFLQSPRVVFASERPEEGSAWSASLFLDAVRAYEEGKYSEAVQGFLALAESGIENGLLYYNLGNAHLKEGDLGRAILWYERARLLIPGDADLQFNLAYARGLTKDQEEDRGGDFVRAVFFWKVLLSPDSVRIWALVLYWAFWTLVLLNLFPRTRVNRPLLVLCGCLALVFVLTAVANEYEAAAGGEGIVVAEEVPVRSGVTSESTELFRLHAGSRVHVDRRQDDHVRITFSRDKIGWIPENAVGVVRFGSS